MTCKMYELIDFPNFFEKVKNQPLSFKTSYRLTLLTTEIEKHINFYQDNFRNLLIAYGQKDENGELVRTEDGQGIKLIEDKIDECNTQIVEFEPPMPPSWTFTLRPVVWAITLPSSMTKVPVHALL